MAHIDFRGRPVAALATETRFLGAATPGTRARPRRRHRELRRRGGRLQRARATSTASAIIELVDCLGPMLPVADFDSPDALRARFALLRDGGAPPGRFHGVAAPDIVPRRARVRASRLTRDAARCPQSAPFFGDHFPRRAGVPRDAAARRADSPRARRSRAKRDWRARALAASVAHDARQDALVHRRRAQRLDARRRRARRSSDGVATVMLSARSGRQDGRHRARSRSRARSAAMNA